MEKSSLLLDATYLTLNFELPRCQVLDGFDMDLMVSLKWANE